MRSKSMMRLEQVTAIFLAAGLAIPSYWFFWSLAGGGGYQRRLKNQNEPLPIKERSQKIPIPVVKDHP